MSFGDQKGPPHRMTVTSVKIGADPDILKLGLSDGSLLSIRLSYVSPPLGVSLSSFPSRSESPALNLSDADYEQVLFACECLRAERKALRLISRAEQTHKGLGMKLSQNRYDEQVVKAVLSRLSQLELVDDRRFAEAWVNTQIRLLKPKSTSQLVAGLLRRGIDQQLAIKVVRDCYPAESEAEAIKRYIEKKHIQYINMSRYELKQLIQQKAGFSKRALDVFLNG